MGGWVTAIDKDVYTKKNISAKGNIGKMGQLQVGFEPFFAEVG